MTDKKKVNLCVILSKADEAIENNKPLIPQDYYPYIVFTGEMTFASLPNWIHMNYRQIFIHESSKGKTLMLDGFQVQEGDYLIKMPKGHESMTGAKFRAFYYTAIEYEELRNKKENQKAAAINYTNGSLDISQILLTAYNSVSELVCQVDDDRKQTAKDIVGALSILHRHWTQS